MSDTPRTKSFMQSLHGYSSSFELFCERVEDFARTLERENAELNECLIDRQKTLMEQAVKLQAASRLLTRCRDSAGRMEMGLYMDIQNFLNS